MQISNAREILSIQTFTPDVAGLDARTTNTVPALYVPEKIKRRERQIASGRRTRLSAFQTGNKKTASSQKRTKRLFVATQRQLPSLTLNTNRHRLKRAAYCLMPSA
ncbi:hypothetical protein ACAX43_11715 [Paraburkholderia sp. IW21]|uniref:hypothetical protein n=1 Tax=Paraburkholderia sp. IW21 TaxID=3242488 RepID=UPI003521A663